MTQTYQTNEVLQRARAEKELTIADLAEKVGVSRVTAWRWEERERVPPTRYWPKLAQVTGIPANRLFSIEGAA